MSSNRLFLTSVIRTIRHTPIRLPSRHITTAAPRPIPRNPIRSAHLRRQQLRWSSESATGSKIWNFEEIKVLSSSPTSESKVIIIDTREPGELQQSGRIPGSLNIPITSAPDSFHISADEFEDRFGFERPGPEDEVVFYCKAGVRSRAAAGIAKEAGWKKVGEYPGSWVDWAGKGGKVERS